MVEYIRSIKITVEVDTNKRTLEAARELDSVTEIDAAAKEIREKIQNSLD